MEPENEDFEDTYDQWEIGEEIGDELQDDWYEVIDSMEFLNQFDYNLNSPIINDHLEEIEKFLHNKDYNPVFYKTTWPDVKEVFKRANLTLSFNANCDWKYHSFIFLDLKDGYKAHKKGIFLPLVRKVLESSKSTGIIIETFFRAWAHLQLDLDEVYSSSKLDNLPTEFLYWGDIFLSLHLIVLHLNVTGDREAKQLSDTFKSRIIKTSTGLIGFVYNSLMHGVVYIIGGYCYFKNGGTLLDRNMILMEKDICISRVQVAMSLLYKQGDLYQNCEAIKKLLNLYLLGDEYLRATKNVGYDGVKLIEPICNLRLCQLAREYRPKIPEFVDFRNHVYTSVQEKDDPTHLLSSFMNNILSETKVDQVLVYYSVFRHWGHPDIDYLEGLEKLHAQTTMEKNIDDDYAQALASDLAYKILKKKFFEKKKWFVDKTKLPEDHPFYNHVDSNTWPNQYQIQQFGDNWHKLPIDQIYDLPDVIDPSLIYSDKSHSLNRSEVLEWIRSNPNNPIPTRRVLQTLLEKPETNWVEFLKRINDYGLDLDSLIIGLKAKEREMKRVGRFFSLMSWELREYFVYTEYLIKEYFVPLFKGLTMADDLQEVMKKMLENVSGQGLDTYDYISIANHVDYEKWNNHQRYESNCYIFKVMGMCFGLPNLFVRSHEFFQKSIIYYNQRPDLMTPLDETLLNKDPNSLVCWDGQAGGLEGLRQKGWSIVNLLVIERESKIRNTLVKVLAQGDNQTISTCYELATTYTDEEEASEINKIIQNNNAVMNAIRTGTTKLGLLINEDETMVSADYLNYGKVPIFRGIIRGLDAKRWARVNFGNNDQVPSLGNMLSSVATNALTVSHFSVQPIDSMVLHNLFGNFTIELLKLYNPALRSPLHNKIKDAQWIDMREFKILVLYLDPSLGGIGGTSLTRFLIRMFPDPVTESLAFWKFIHDNTQDKMIKQLAISCGYPILEDFQPHHIDKLIENPVGLNISRGISAVNLLKNQVRQNLVQNRSKILNTIIRSSLDYIDQEETTLYAWARSIRPLFPRFMSEMINATYYGITNSIVGLFQNSRTIRNQYKTRYAKRIDDVICISEIIGIASMIRIAKRALAAENNIWECSSTHADELRLNSWGTPVLGTTVPHPLELLNQADNLSNLCGGCKASGSYLSVMIPKGLRNTRTVKGPYPPYLGSRTSETTSLIQPWDKETNIPLLKRAVKLRNAISWFIKPESTLAASILNNLESLTGEDWSSFHTGFKRTGSALHRFTCSRQSNGGFSASSPTNLTWMICTTDTMEALNEKNYDFMFQSLIIYAQATASVCWDLRDDPINVHFHVSCGKCIREIEEPWLESEWELLLPDVHYLLGSWRPDPNASWGSSKVRMPITEGNWEKVPQSEKSFHIGHVIGFLFTDMFLSHSKHVEDSSLFPLGIRGKLFPPTFFEGLFLGVQRACALQLIHRRNLIELKKPKIAQWGLSFYVLENLCESTGFLNLLRDGPLYQEIINQPHKLPSSYPLNNRDLGLIGRSYLKTLLVRWFSGQIKLDFNKKIWLFADLQSHDIIGSMSISLEALKLVMTSKQNLQFRNSVRKIQEIYVNVKNEKWEVINVPELTKNIITSPQELRHAVKFGVTIQVKPEEVLPWGKEWVGNVITYDVLYDSIDKVYDPVIVPRRTHPLISALRTNQFATGAHYKIRSIINHLNIKWTAAICGGDGSGGISAYLCRSNPNGKVLFNSLLMMDGINFKGSHPSPPSALVALRGGGKNCINLHDVWKHPSDLAQKSTWEYFKREGITKGIHWDLIVLDMEVVNEDMIEAIESNIQQYGLQILSPRGSMILKSYIGRLINANGLLNKLGPQFQFVKLCQTEASSSYTSEVYVVFYSLELTTVPQLYPDKQDLSFKIRTAFCFKNHADEFNRAKRLQQQDLMIGVPSSLIPDPTVDLSTMLTILGMESGYAVSIAKSWVRYKGKNHVNYLIAITLLCCESNYQTTHKCYKEITIPSNPKIANMMVVTLALWIWISIKHDSLALYSQTYELINSQSVINFGPFSSKKGSVYQNWSLTEKLAKSKVFRISSRSSRIGQLVRLYQRMYQRDPMKMDETQIQNILSFYNKGLIPKRLLFSTGVMNFLLNM
ncbi:polymerase [Mosqueiro virus]|uniref:Replicase n=1 Tax=Mosqueiro virus TaxID=200403 RepID=A0A0D3R233_9RHAB|nr:polymerase [Mosqueiro virus]AJR28515.1 polymerase [Mosqueiro virus]